MKFEVDYVGRNDGYDDETFRFYESVDADGYFYEVYVLIDKEKAAIAITDNGVSVDFMSGSSIHTNIVPNKMFQGQKFLSWNQIAKILTVLENTDLEGVTYSKEQMESSFQEWKELNPDYSDDD